MAERVTSLFGGHILQALVRYYDRMADRGEIEPQGFSRENISFAIELSQDGVSVSVLNCAPPTENVAFPLCSPYRQR
jgi:hypothetical protein